MKKETNAAQVTLCAPLLVFLGNTCKSRPKGLLVVNEFYNTCIRQYDDVVFNLLGGLFGMTTREGRNKRITLNFDSHDYHLNTNVETV